MSHETTIDHHYVHLLQTYYSVQGQVRTIYKIQLDYICHTRTFIISAQNNNSTTSDIGMIRTNQQICQSCQ